MHSYEKVTKTITNGNIERYRRVSILFDNLCNKERMTVIQIHVYITYMCKKEPESMYKKNTNDTTAGDVRRDGRHIHSFLYVLIVWAILIHFF